MTSHFLIFKEVYVNLNSSLHPTPPTKVDLFFASVNRYLKDEHTFDSSRVLVLEGDGSDFRS